MNMKRQRVTLASKIEMAKKEIARIRSNISTEAIKVKNYTADLEMFQNEKKAQKEKAARSTEDAEKIEKKFVAFNAERDSGLEKMFKQQIEDMLLSEKRSIMSTMSKISEPVQVLGCLSGVEERIKHRLLQFERPSRKC